MVVTAATFGLVAAACSSDGTSDSTTSSPATATASTGGVTTTAAGGGATETTGGSVASAPATTTASSSPATETPKPGGELIMAGDAEVAQPWTPAAMQCDPYCYQRARTFFDELAVVGTDKKVHPYLAESIEHNSDYSQWTVKIRSGVNFTDGTPVNADAVIRNLNDAGSGLLIRKALVDVARNPDDTFVIDKVDDLTLTIHTGKNGDPSQPLSWPGFDFYLTANWALIASPTWLDAVKADPTKATQPVGSGPFIFQSYSPRDSLVVTRNPNYWLKDANGVQLPYLDKITFRVIEDAKTSEQALRSGDIDIFSTSRAQIIQDFHDDDANVEVREQSKYGETSYLLIDLSKDTALQDQRVRCALSYAIDRVELNDLTAAGLPKIANGLFSPGQEGYLDDNGLDTSKQDMDKAKELIDEYEKETGKSDIEIVLGSTADAITQQAAELMTGYWKELGVDARIDTVPQDQYITNALLGADNFIMYQWRSHAGYTIDQQNFWWNSSSVAPDGQISINFGRMSDPDVDANLAIARSDPDPAKRQAAAEAVNRIFAEKCYQIPLSWAIWATASKDSVKGFDEMKTPDGVAYLEQGQTTNGGVIPVAYLWLD
ncbi:MAG: ABC transporter substrate-binding protein [Ilumatobacteraceae bacterium]